MSSPALADAQVPAHGGLIDTHCHLDAAEFAADREQVITQAAAAGVSTMLLPAVEMDSFAAIKALCAPGSSANLQGISMRAAFGVHPMTTPRARDSDLAVLRQWLIADRPAAIGEIGLDGFVPGLDMARQQWFFVEQLKLAREFDLPVLVHIRRAQDPILKLLRKNRVRGGIAHAFNGSRQQADEFIRLGFKLGFGGAMTFNGSTRIRQLARELPLECMVLETDAPDIPPAWLNGGRNAPAELARIAGVLAELRQVSLDDIARATSANARAVIPGLS